MIELELLGANGDRIVMTDPDGERYTIVVDDALRGAVRRARPTALVPTPEPVKPGRPVRPRDLQALMRAGATASEAAQATGADIEQVRRFEGPVLAERAWAVEQARACRIGWHKDSPVLGDLVMDRLATRGVEPTTLTWDALRHGREPWQIVLTFVQGAEEKRARWELDLSARSVSALDDEARWLTETATRRTDGTGVFDQDAIVTTVSPGGSDMGTEMPAVAAVSAASAAALPGEDLPTDTDLLLADLANNRGVRAPSPLSADLAEDGDLPAPKTGAVVSIQARAAQLRREAAGRHPAGSRLPSADALIPQTSTVASEHAPVAAPLEDDIVAAPPSAEAGAEAGSADLSTATGQQEALPDMPAAPAPAPKKRHSRRSVPSWDEIVFGAKPE